MGLLVNLNNPVEESERKDAEAAAHTLGLRLEVLNATNEVEIDAAFSSLLERRIGALVVGTDPLYLGFSQKVVALAAGHAIPARLRGGSAEPCDAAA